MGHELTIEPLGETLTVAEGQTILDACLRAGVYLPHACGHGLCGTCKILVLDGEIDHGAASPFALMDFEREDGFVLACTCTLRADVSVEADVDEDPDGRRIAVDDFAGEVVALENLVTGGEDPRINGAVVSWAATTAAGFTARQRLA